MISSGLGGGGVARARFFEASSSGVIVIVGLAVAEGVPVVVGAPAPLALPLAFGCGAWCLGARTSCDGGIAATSI